MTENIRCFIALEIPREAIDYIEEVQGLIKKKNFFFGKFTEPENLHLTLKFLGEIDEDRVQEVQNRLKGIKFEKFEVSLGEIGVFINKFNSILWIKLNGPEIWGLQKFIDEKVKDLFSLESKFMSHITIARMKKIHDKQIFLDYIKNIKQKKINFKIKELILKKSELKPEGPVYTDIERYPLKE